MATKGAAAADRQARGDDGAGHRPSGVATNVDALPFDDTNAWLSLRDPRRDAPGPTLKASDGIRGEGGDDETDDDAQWYPENTDHSAPTTATSAGASTASPRATLVATAGRVVPRPPSRPPATPKLNAPVDTLPPRDSVGRSKSLGRRQVGGLPEWATRRPDQKERSEVGTEAFDGSERAVAWSPLDAAIRPLQAFAAFMQNQAEMAEGELSRRVSGLEESFTQELTAMQKTLAGERLASKEKLKQAEEQLAQLRDLSAEKRRVEAGAEKLEADAKQASAAYNASLERLQAEVDSMKNRLEKEKASMAASQAEVAALKASQERERERAKESLAKLETELERERQVAGAKQASICEEISARAREQSRALDLAEKRVATADLERTRAEDSRAKAEARFRSVEATATSAVAESAKTRGRAEREVALAREQAAAAAATAAAAVEAAEEARSGSGIDRLEAELEAATAELRVQTKKAREIEGAKERAEAKAARRNRGLEELMEKNRARSEKALAGLREQVKELEPIRVAAAGFEDVKAELGLAQNRSSQLEGEVATLTKKVEVLDQRLAQSAQRSLEEAKVLERKERALTEAEAQLQAARERSAQLEGDLMRFPSLQKRLGEAKEEAERQRIRADDLQAGRKEAVAQNELVKDRLFDLERSVEMTEWGERKLERENKGLQGLIERNRTRYEREFAKLKAASADLVDKTAALQDLEAVVTREREQAEEMGRQVKNLKKQSTATAEELIVTRDKLTKETEKRLRAEAALRQATDKSYVEKLQAAEYALLKARQEGQEAVESVQATLRKERASWDTERTTLSRRVEQAMGSSKDRSNQLEDEAKLLRLESQQGKAQAEDLRGQLQRATTLVSETKAEKERLQGELVLAMRAVEDRSTLQQSIKRDLNSFDESSTPLEPSPRSPVESRRPDGNPHHAPGSSTSTSATPVVEAGGDLLLQARERLTEAAAFLSGPNREENAERYRLLLNDSELRENAEAASAIDEFLEKSQGTEVGADFADGSDSDLASSVPPASQEGFENGEADGSGNKEGVAVAKSGAHRRKKKSWMESSRWSKIGQAQR